MNQKLLYPIVALALGATGGFLVDKGGKSSAADAAKEAEMLARTSRSESLSSSSARREAGSGRARSADDIQKMPGQFLRMQSLLDFYARLSPEQLEEEAKKLEGIPEPERTLASYGLFARWAETDPLSAMAFSDKMNFPLEFVKPTIMQSWASIDPVNASKYYSENPGQFVMNRTFGGRGGDGLMGNGAASIIAVEWARQNPDDAMAWAKTLADPRTGNGVMVNARSSIVSLVASTDLQKAMVLVATLPGDEQSYYNFQIAEALGSKSWDEAQQFISGLPTDQQDDARDSAIYGLAYKNPAEAANQLASFTDEGLRSRATATVAEQMSREDPAGAFSLVISSGSAEQEDAISKVMVDYARQDSAGALQAISTIPQGDARDTAIGTFVFASNSTNYSETFALAETITDERDRSRAIGVSASRWMTTDPGAAKAAIQQSTTLSDEMKTRIIGRGGRGGDGGGNSGSASGGRAAGGQ